MPGIYLSSISFPRRAPLPAQPGVTGLQGAVAAGVVRTHFTCHTLRLHMHEVPPPQKQGVGRDTGAGPRRLSRRVRRLRPAPRSPARAGVSRRAGLHPRVVSAVSAAALTSRRAWAPSEGPRCWGVGVPACSRGRGDSWRTPSRCGPNLSVSGSPSQRKACPCWATTCATTA